LSGISFNTIDSTSFGISTDILEGISFTVIGEQLIMFSVAEDILEGVSFTIPTGTSCITAQDLLDIAEAVWSHTR